MYLVTGATGNVGGAVVRALAASGHEVAALVRRDGGDWPAGVHEVVGDLNRPETFAGGLEGVRGAFLLSGYENLDGLLVRLHEAGAERVVLLSGSSVPGGDTGNAVAAYQIASERTVRDSGVAWTALQPNSFMSNTFDWADQLRAGDLVRAPFAGVAVAAIHPDDIGEVAATALTAGGYEGQALRLSGPESLRPADRARILGEALGRELRFEGQPDDEARTEMEAAMPKEYVDAFFSFFVDGELDESEVLPTVEQVVGRPPRSFAQWAREHAADFAA